MMTVIDMTDHEHCLERGECWRGSDERAQCPSLSAERRTDDDGKPISDMTQCGACLRWWDDAIVTSMTPAPSGRCPFEYEHASDDLPTTGPKMLGKDEFAEAARYSDARAEEHGLEEYMRQLGVDVPGLVYLVNQRALRAVMTLEGRNPNVWRTTVVKLSAEGERLLPYFASAEMDGIVIGMNVRHHIVAELKRAVKANEGRELTPTEARRINDLISQLES